MRKGRYMCLYLFIFLHPAWSCSGFLPGLASAATVAPPTKLSWISVDVIWKSHISKTFFFFLSFRWVFLCVLRHFPRTPGDSVRPCHTCKGARCLDEARGCRKPVDLEWSKCEVEAEFNLQENLENNVLQHLITRPREQSDWTRRVRMCWINLLATVFLSVIFSSRYIKFCFAN